MRETSLNPLNLQKLIAEKIKDAAENKTIEQECLSQLKEIGGIDDKQFLHNLSMALQQSFARNHTKIENLLYIFDLILDMTALASSVDQYNATMSEKIYKHTRTRSIDAGLDVGGRWGEGLGPLTLGVSVLAAPAIGCLVGRANNFFKIRNRDTFDIRGMIKLYQKLYALNKGVDDTVKQACIEEICSEYFKRKSTFSSQSSQDLFEKLSSTKLSIPQKIEAIIGFINDWNNAGKAMYKIIESSLNAMDLEDQRRLFPQNRV